MPLDFVARLKVEIGDLTAKHTALKNFIAENPTFRGLPKEDQALMILQEHHMRQYADILLRRYDRLQPPKENPSGDYPRSDE